MSLSRPTPHFHQILHYITPHRRVLSVILGLLALGSAVSLANPWMAGLLTANVTESSPSGLEIKPLLILWMCLLLVQAALSFASQYYIGSTGERITSELRMHLYQQLQALPISYYQQRKPGDTLTLLSTDADIISGFVTDTLVQLLPALLTFVGAFVLMAWLDITIALLVIIFMPIYFLAMKIIGRRMRPLSRAWVDANSDMISVVEENLGLLPVIKAFTRERQEQERFGVANTRLLSLSRKQLKISAMLSPAVGLLGGLGILIMLWVGTAHIENGSLSTGELVSVLLYAALLMSPLRTLADVYGQTQRTLGSAERIAAFLVEHPEPSDEGDLELGDVKGSIEFQNVSFAYPDRPPVLENFFFRIAAGETVAITGQNGAGKSTLANLIIRFADPQAGAIYIDGEDIRNVTLASLRARIGLVAQHVLLLNGTVADNIAYADPLADRETIEKAAIAANAHDFIAALNDGYDTVIGDQGIRLSGGQRQRISLARTLLKDPQILIFDEATAMFDPAGEQSFIEECRDLLSQKTVIFITHRAAPLGLADRVLELKSSAITTSSAWVPDTP
ncbi:MAG: ABC transporter ATP-binding protein [Cyanobacteria bacterium P01_F01_bin.3]